MARALRASREKSHPEHLLAARRARRAARRLDREDRDPRRREACRERAGCAGAQPSQRDRPAHGRRGDVAARAGSALPRQGELVRIPVLGARHASDEDDSRRPRRACTEALKHAEILVKNATGVIVPRGHAHARPRPVADARQIRRGPDRHGRREGSPSFRSRTGGTAVIRATASCASSRRAAASRSSSAIRSTSPTCSPVASATPRRSAPRSKRRPIVSWVPSPGCWLS